MSCPKCCPENLNKIPSISLINYTLKETVNMMFKNWHILNSSAKKTDDLYCYLWGVEKNKYYVEISCPKLVILIKVHIERNCKHDYASRVTHFVQ